MVQIKKNDSFTLSEVLVVMLITSMVITIAVLVLNIVQKEVAAIQLNFKQKTDVRSLEQALWNDLNTHRVFFKKETNHIITISKKDTVSYHFMNDFLLRNTDTIQLSGTTIKPYLDNLAVNDGEIDGLELALDKKSNFKKLFIYKTKSASYYMNQ